MRRALVVAWYAALTLLVAWPLLGRGYVFALDHAMGPNVARLYGDYVLHNVANLQNKGGYALLLAALVGALGVVVAQKLILFGPFLVAGLGAHVLAKRSGAGTPGALFAGTLYALSPFAYVRAVVGQSGVLWMYALLPLVLLAWLAAARGSRRGLVAAALLVTLVGVFQGHGLLLSGILIGAHLVALAIRREDLRQPLKAASVLLLALLALNAWWWAPVVFASDAGLPTGDAAEKAFFATRAESLPSVGHAALTLQGFWRAGYEPYYASGAALLLPAAMLFLALQGLVLGARNPLHLGVGVAGLVGLVLGMGPSSTLARPLFEFAWDHVPLFQAFREPQKLLALLALAYALLGARAVHEWVGWARAWRPGRAAPLVATAALLALPLAAAAVSPLANGFDGQLKTAQYPEGWREVEDATAGCDGVMLVAPWHLYMDVGFVPNPDKRVTNPAKTYFSCPVLASEDIEAGSDAPRDPRQAYVRRWLVDAPEVRDLGNLLSPLDVQYVLVLKESDWRAFAKTLDAQSDLRVKLQNDEAILYENLALRANPSTTRDVLPANDLQAAAEQGPLAGRVITAHDITPGTYVVHAPRAPFPMSGWVVDGAGPIDAREVPLAHPAGGGTPEWRPLRAVVLPSIAISGAALVVCLGALVQPTRRPAAALAEVR